MAWVAVVLQYDCETALRCAAASFMAAMAVAAIAGVSGALVLLISLITKKKKQPITIEIPDSPPPSRHECTAESISRWSVVRARRAGRRRLKGIARKWTRAFSSHTSFHCGYMSVLWLAQRACTEKNIMELRRLVSMDVYTGFTENHMIAGKSVRAIVAGRQMSLRAYMADTQFLQWASIMELHYACCRCGIQTLLMDKGEKTVIGEGRFVGAISLRAGHYMALRKHKRTSTTCSTTPSLRRGGMLSKREAPKKKFRVTFDDEVTTYMQEDEAEHDCEGEHIIQVDVSYLKHKVKDIIFDAKGWEGVFEVKAELAKMLDIEQSSFNITMTCDHGPIPNWCDLPSGSYVLVPEWWRGSEALYKVKIANEAGDRTCTVRVPENLSESHFREIVAMHLDMEETTMALVGQDGQYWSYTRDLRKCRNLFATSRVKRGGMERTSRSRSRPRSISPTVPFGPATEEEVLQDNVETPQRPPAGEGTQAPVGHAQRQGEEIEDYWTPEAGDRNGELEDQYDSDGSTIGPTPVRAFNLGVLPSSSPPAQVMTCAKAVYDNFRFVGRLRAPSHVNPQTVMKEAYDKMHMYRMPTYTPVDATSWNQLSHVQFPPPLAPNVESWEDLRMSKWEDYQGIGTVPVLEHGIVYRHLVMPIKLSMLQAQVRVQQWASWRYLPHLFAFDNSNWLVYMKQLPHDIIGIVEDSSDPRATEIKEENTEETPGRDVPFHVELAHEGGEPYEVEQESTARGGGKRQGSVDPRAMMQNLAKDRIQKEFPSMNHDTISMLLKAEHRTTTAALNAKDSSQVRQVVNAALKRAGLSSKDEEAPVKHDMNELVNAVWTNVQLMQALCDQIAVCASRDDLHAFMNACVEQMDKQAKSMERMTVAICDLKEKVRKCEQRLGEPQHTTIIDDDDSPTLVPTEVGDASLEHSEEEEQHTQHTPMTPERPTRAESRGAHDDDAQSVILESLRARSVRAQCGRALAPFRASQ